MGLRLDLSDPAIEAAAAVYWTWKERQNALSYDHTDEESDAIYHPMMQAYDALMAIPATNARELGIKARIYAGEIFPCCSCYDSPDITGILSDAERLGGLRNV